MNGKPELLSRRNFVAGGAAATVCFMLGSSLVGCQSEQGSTGGSSGNNGTFGGNGSSGAVDYADWSAVLEAAKGSKVSWYGWGGSEPRNTWINNTLAKRLKDNYDVTLELVGMNINDILTKLSGEMQAGVKEGTIDFIWINGENFFSTKESGYLWGPFCTFLPNFNNYVDAQSPDIAYDFGSPTEGFEAPYGKAQMQMWYDSAKITSVPKNPNEFLQFCKDHKGMVTYPEPGDFTGTAFISCLIAGVVGKAEFEKLSKMQSPTVEAVEAVVGPGMEYLRSLNPYLWKEGKTFPSDSTMVATMYADGELVINMGYGAPESLVKSGQLPGTTRSFIFDTGTVGNTHFMAIAANAPHKAAALVAINEVLSPEMQLSQFKDLSYISVLDIDSLPASQKTAFEGVTLGVTELPLSTLLDHRVAEVSGRAIPLLEQIWLNQVPGK